ncbi:HicB family protein [Suicoccus acidiformans]|uniref:HicB family protein n=1 Tax=Suicoccus acidiformans TaxID=2036206 RepID=A0A347WKP7_9LACT|nr:type II toxin-antitoxin system HicB family antitoxin [Suicoccus acidiformans]AXY25654.1 HicB family protein [Suicoccus acidiformans]
MYLYYAVFSPNDSGYDIEFPDLDGAFTFGDNMSDALYMAKDLLEGWLIIAEKEKDPIPEASEPSAINHEPNDLIIPIEVDLELAKKKHANTLIKKTLTIPAYLNDLGNQANINFSATLTEALREKLGERVRD